MAKRAGTAERDRARRKIKSTDRVFEVVRAKRVELVDDDGNAWGVLARTAHPDGDERGLSLYDDTGEWAWFTLGVGGPDLGMNQGGNVVIALGVFDGHDVVSPGARLALCKSDGAPFFEQRASS